MAKDQENQEPSIEEILDSIRQIISDDEEQAVAEEAAPEPEVIELTERVTDEPDMQVDMKEPEQPEPPPERESEPVKAAASPPTPPPIVEAKVEPPPAPKPAPAPMPKAGTPENFESILTKNAEDSVMDAFTELSKRASIERGQGITIEEIVRQELRPMLKHWLDYHLPGLVEKLLQKEMERISKKVLGDD